MRSEMSQRALLESMTQPTLPLGEVKALRSVIASGSAVSGACVPVWLDGDVAVAAMVVAGCIEPVDAGPADC